MGKTSKRVVIAIIVVIIALLGYGEYKKYRTVYDVFTDADTSTVITGLADEERIERYKYLAIPDKDFVVKSWDIRTPYARITDIGESAFESNTYIESVYIPVNIVRIRNNAFKGCTSIQSVSYAGTEQQWKQIVIEAGNEALTNVTVKCNAKMPKVPN